MTGSSDSPIGTTPDLSLVPEEALLDELKKRNDTVICYADKIDYIKDGTTHGQISRTAKGTPLSLLGLAHLILHEARDQVVVAYHRDDDA